MGIAKRRLMEQQMQGEMWEDRPHYPSSAEASEDEGTESAKENKTEITKDPMSVQRTRCITRMKDNLSFIAPSLQLPIATFSPFPSISMTLYATSVNSSDRQLVFEWDLKHQEGVPRLKAFLFYTVFLYVDSQDIQSEISSDLPMMPSSDDKITFAVSNHEIEKAEKTSNGLFKFSTHSDYVVHLSFLARASAPQPFTIDDVQAKDSVREGFALNSTPYPFDVRLVFITNDGKRDQSLWTSSELLKRSSTFFENLFNPELSSLVKKSDDQRNLDENMNGGDSDMSSTLESLISDNDSDAGVDEMTFEAPSPSHEPISTFPYYRLQISDAACTTYKAVLTYLQFNHIRFAPLTSSFEPLPEDMRHLARLDYLSKHKLDDPLLPYPASPKSIYRLAHSLDLSSLSKLALSNYSSQLSPCNVAFEMMDPIIDEHEQVCQVLVDYLVKNWNEIVKDGNFKELLEKVKKDEVTLSGALVAKLLPLLRGRGLNVEGRVIGSLNG